MNLPNALTILRIFFVPFLVAVMVEQDLRIEWRGVVVVSNAFLALAIFLAAAATDLLDRLFSNSVPPIAAVRRMGLGAVNQVPPLRRFFMRRAMGAAGALSRLGRGDEV